MIFLEKMFIRLLIKGCVYKKSKLRKKSIYNKEVIAVFFSAGFISFAIKHVFLLFYKTIFATNINFCVAYDYLTKNRHKFNALDYQRRYNGQKIVLVCFGLFI